MTKTMRRLFSRPTATLALTAKTKRLLLSALLLAGAVQGAWATDYITDVMLIGSARAKRNCMRVVAGITSSACDIRSASSRGCG